MDYSRKPSSTRTRKAFKRNNLGKLISPAGGKARLRTLNAAQPDNLNQTIGAVVQVYFEVDAVLRIGPAPSPRLPGFCTAHGEGAVCIEPVVHVSITPDGLGEWVGGFGGYRVTTRQPDQHQGKNEERFHSSTEVKMRR